MVFNYGEIGYRRGGTEDCGHKRKKVGKKGVENSIIEPPTSNWENLKKSFRERKYPVSEISIMAPSPRPNEESSEEYADFFLSHA